MLTAWMVVIQHRPPCKRRTCLIVKSVHLMMSKALSPFMLIRQGRCTCNLHEFVNTPSLYIPNANTGWHTVKNQSYGLKKNNNHGISCGHHKSGNLATRPRSWLENFCPGVGEIAKRKRGLEELVEPRAWCGIIWEDAINNYWRSYGDLGIDKADTGFNNQFETGIKINWYVLSTSRIRAGHTATQFPILPGGHDKDSWQSLMTGNVLPCVERCCFLQGVSGFWIFVVPVWLQMFGGYPAMLNGLMVSKLEFMCL